MLLHAASTRHMTKKDLTTDKRRARAATTWPRVCAGTRRRNVRNGTLGTVVISAKQVPPAGLCQSFRRCSGAQPGAARRPAPRAPRRVTAAIPAAITSAAQMAAPRSCDGRADASTSQSGDPITTGSRALLGPAGLIRNWNLTGARQQVSPCHAANVGRLARRTRLAGPCRGRVLASCR